MADESRIILRATDETRAAFDAVKANFEGIKASAGRMQGLLAGIGGALGVGISAAAFAGAVKGVTELEDALFKMSQRTGASVESLSTLRYAADLSGVSLEDLDGMLVKLNKTLGQAGAGDQKAADFLKQFGISANEVRAGTLQTDEALKRIADRFATAPDGINKTTAAVELFGKSGAGMIAFLNEGRAGIEAMQGDARRLGLELSTNAAKAAQDFNDSLRTLSFASEGAKMAIVGSLMPSLTAISRAMRDATIEGGKFKGFLAGLATLLTGDDQYKNNKALADQTEALLRWQDKLDESRNRFGKDDARTKAIAGNIKILQDQIASTRAYGIELDKVNQAEEQAAKARDNAKKNGAQLEVKKPADTGSIVDQLKSIQTFADQVSEQLTGKLGGEFEKLREKAGTVFSKIDVSKLNSADVARFGAIIRQTYEDIAKLEQLDAATRQLKSQADYYNAIAENAAKADDAARNFILGQARGAQDLQFELDMVGKLSSERQKLAAIRKIDREEQAALAAVPDDATNRDLRVEQIQQAAEQSRAATGRLYDSIREKSRDTFVGLNSAAREYFDRVTDQAQNMRRAFDTIMGSLEDTLVKTFTTGKLSVKDFVDTAVAELVRLQVRKNIIAPLSQAIDGLTFGGWNPGGIFGGGGSANIVGEAFAAGGRPPMNKVSLVGEAGPELFVPDSPGTIVPNGALDGLGGHSVTVVQHINIDSRSDRSSILAAMVQAKEMAKAEIMDSMLRGGAFAR